ncbi:MAG: MarR family transcriptional regulator [Alphaproteobacteria bacterium]|nr:MarR family transcriptional regulator [Alphaproteobacteria bacterium]
MRRDAQLPTRLWLRLLVCGRLIERELRHRLRRDFATTLPRFDVLAQLERAPEGLSMGELSRQLMVSNGNVTGLVAGLARQGLVAHRDESDRRRRRVALTAAGRRVFGRQAAAHRRWLDRLMVAVAPADQRRLHELLGNMRTALARPRKGRS